MPSDLMRKMALYAAVVLVPLGLLHAFVLAEIAVGVVDVLFLVETLRTRNVAWLRQPWMMVALLWWGWLLICSLPLPGFGVAGWAMGFGQAVVVVRFLLFTAALQSWLLTEAPARRLAWVVLALACAWIGLESWEQLLTGKNIFGYPRWCDGALTGPFWKPRAGPLFSHLLFTAMLPPVMLLLGKPGWGPRLAGVALAVLGVVTSVLIGQRMGVALTGLGLVVTALFMPRLRLPVALCAVLGVVVLVATPIISPATHGKLVGETQHNFHHFSQSPYGEIFTRATVMGLQSPIDGWGMNGYRVACPEDRFAAGLPALGIPPTQLSLQACIQHPQNFFIQSFSDGGVPGFVLFVAMMLTLMLALGRGLWRHPDPLRVGLFISALNYTWPISSTDEFPVMYMLGWFFLFLGLGLACADAQFKADSKGMKNV